MTKIPGRLTGITVSDIHFGVGSVPPSDISTSLKEVLFGGYKSTSRAATVDVIVLAGDIFDKELDFGGDAARCVMSWFTDLLTFAAANNILLLLLQGTYSHDREQCRRLAEYARRLIDNGLDLKFGFYDDVTVVNHLGYDMLFVPDNHAPKTSITLNAVKEALNARGLEQVDLAFMHGTFRHQLKYGDDEHKHDVDEYLAMVRHWIMSGHIHSRSVYNRFIAQGSWPRTAHGEEETKGAVWWRVDKLDGDAFEFIDNTQAKIFKSLRLTTSNLDESLRQVDQLVGKLPHGSSIRIDADKNHPLIVAFNNVKQLYPFHEFKKKTDNISDEEELKTVKALSPDEYTPMAINQNNIVEITLAEVKSKHQLTPHEESNLLRILRGIRVK